MTLATRGHITIPLFDDAPHACVSGATGFVFIQDSTPGSCTHPPRLGMVALSVTTGRRRGIVDIHDGSAHV